MALNDPVSRHFAEFVEPFLLLDTISGLENVI